MTFDIDKFDPVIFHSIKLMGEIKVRLVCYCTVCPTSFFFFNFYTYKLGKYATIFPRSLDPIYFVTLYIKWDKTSWTDSRIQIYIDPEIYLMK